MTDWNNVCYVHVDLDAFFASVEQLDHPEYRGKPVIVGGNPKDRRGVVSTASSSFTVTGFVAPFIVILRKDTLSGLNAYQATLRFHVSLFWDTHALVPAFRFNLVTLVSSIVLLVQSSQIV